MVRRPYHRQNNERQVLTAHWMNALNTLIQIWTSYLLVCIRHRPQAHTHILYESPTRLRLRVILIGTTKKKNMIRNHLFDAHLPSKYIIGSELWSRNFLSQKKKIKFIQKLINLHVFTTNSLNCLVKLSRSMNNSPPMNMMWRWACLVNVPRDEEENIRIYEIAFKSLR